MIRRSAPRGLVLGIDFGGTKTAVGCATLDGELVAHRRLPTLADRGAAQVVDRALKSGSALCRELVERDEAQLMSVGVVSPGVVLADRVLLAPNIPGWEALALPQLVSRAVPGVPVATLNDAHAAALAELRWGHLQGIHTGLYVNVGTGLSAAVVVNGQVLEGAHHAAGEVGYVRAGTRGPQSLESLLGGRWLAQRVSRAAGSRLSAADAFAASTPVVREMVDAAIDELGRHLASFSTLLDPGRIVIGGGIMNAAGRILPRLRRWLDEVVPFPPELMAGAFVTDGALRGAVAIAIEVAAEDGPRRRPSSRGVRGTTHEG